MGSLGGEAYDKPIDQVEYFEGIYRSALKVVPEVSAGREIRDIGWDEFRTGSKDKGLLMLNGSAELLSHASQMFSREVFATDARIAQAYCVLGEFGKAAEIANRALDNMPKRIMRFEGWDLGFISEFGLNPDQYEVTFSGRLSLILGASGNDADFRNARELAIKARRLARISERPDRVVFADKKMTDDERKGARSKHRKAAWAASIGWMLPLTVPDVISKKSPIPPSRRDMAQAVCAR